MAKETAQEMLLKKMKKAAPAVAVSAKPAKPALKKINFNFSIAQLNRLLFLGVIICIVGLLMELRSGFSKLNEDVDLSGNAGKASIAQVAMPSSKTADYYLGQVNSRNIFKPYEAQTAEKAVEGSKGLAARLSKFKVVGVAWLDLPETASVMIEDIENKTTYFLKQGEQLEGVTIKTIYTDRAVFGYENEETTIKL